MDIDHTKIDIDFDPTIQRMQGVAYHGNTPFDVPFISHIDGNLYQGGTQFGLVLPEHIEHLISLYPWEKYTVNHELKTEHYVKMYDSLDQAFDQVDEIARLVVECEKDGPTVVLCQAGLNRSSLVAARSLMLSRGLRGQEAVAFVRERRSPACLCNPAFEDWLVNL